MAGAVNDCQMCRPHTVEFSLAADETARISHAGSTFPYGNRIPPRSDFAALEESGLPEKLAFGRVAIERVAQDWNTSFGPAGGRCQ